MAETLPAEGEATVPPDGPRAQEAATTADAVPWREGPGPADDRNGHPLSDGPYRLPDALPVDQSGLQPKPDAPITDRAVAYPKPDGPEVDKGLFLPEQGAIIQKDGPFSEGPPPSCGQWSKWSCWGFHDASILCTGICGGYTLECDSQGGCLCMTPGSAMACGTIGVNLQDGCATCADAFAQGCCNPP
jgi:hypothetical protein